jgi:hypothetical protein
MADLLAALDSGEMRVSLVGGVSEDWELDCSASLILIGQDCIWPLDDWNSDQT